MLINNNILDYAAKFQDQGFNYGTIFALKNDLLLWCDLASLSRILIYKTP